eukprot:6886521-Lingulodinium_polyedra.AAC.1
MHLDVATGAAGVAGSCGRGGRFRLVRARPVLAQAHAPHGVAHAGAPQVAPGDAGQGALLARRPPAF